MTANGVDRSGAAGGSGSSQTPIDSTIIDAKGDLIAGTAADTAARLAVGADGLFLSADSTQATGLKWLAAVVKSLFTTKGDIMVATAASTPVRKGVGADGTLLSSDSTQTDGLAWVTQYSAGDVKLSFKTVADSGWVLMDDGSIGSATSGATSRANADTATLYSLLWTNVSNTFCPVAGGRGGSAAADFAANKAMTLPRAVGRALAVYGAGTQVESGVDADVDLTANTFVVVSNNSKWFTGMQVTFTLASGTITGLVSGSTYYVIRNTSSTIKLASTLANAQNGTAIDITAKSSPVWSITHSFVARALAEMVGEQTHAMSSTEALAHTHGISNEVAIHIGNDQPIDGTSSTAGDDGAWSSISATSTGGNAAMNITDPTLYLNAMIKL